MARSSTKEKEEILLMRWQAECLIACALTQGRVHSSCPTALRCPVASDSYPKQQSDKQIEKREVSLHASLSQKTCCDEQCEQIVCFALCGAASVRACLSSSSFSIHHSQFFDREKTLANIACGLRIENGELRMACFKRSPLPSALLALSR